MTGPWPRRGRVVATSRGHRRGGGGTWPSVGHLYAPPNNRVNTHTHAHTRPRIARSLSIATGHVSGHDNNNIISSSRRTRLRSRLRSSARSARVYSLESRLAAAATLGRYPPGKSPTWCRFDRHRDFNATKKLRRTRHNNIILYTILTFSVKSRRIFLF